MVGAKARSLRGDIVEGPYSRSRRGAANPWVLLRTHIIPWRHHGSPELDRRQGPRARGVEPDRNRPVGRL